ncbi:winged helix-turn-helix transcriptional regulator [Methanocella sp. MCL-LM]|uniref:winged helix-turn-helix transcriptional regulator n=1 Tax=Methanocella sp. MCL-LM TaxID=3412035 RepID=UPI003C77A12B
MEVNRLKSMELSRIISLACFTLGIAGICLTYVFYPMIFPGSPGDGGQAYQPIDLGEPRQVSAAEVPPIISIHYYLLSLCLLAASLISLHWTLIASKSKGLLNSGLCWITAVVPLYSRFNNNNVLDGRTRKLVYEYAVSHPGSTRPQIAHELGLNEGTVTYHLDVLEKANGLLTVKVDKAIHYFARNRLWDKMELRLHARLNNETGKLLLNSILERPHITSIELCRLSNRSKSTISWHIKRLEQDGIIRVQKAGRNSYNCISEVAAPLLARLSAGHEHLGNTALANASMPDPSAA